MSESKDSYFDEVIEFLKTMYKDLKESNAKLINDIKKDSADRFDDNAVTIEAIRAVARMRVAEEAAKQKGTQTEEKSIPALLKWIKGFVIVFSACAIVTVIILFVHLINGL